MPVSQLKFVDRYMLMEEIGTGAFSTVHRCINRITLKPYAVKVINKKKMDRRELYKLESEARICKMLDHPNIVKLYGIVSEPNAHYFIFDLVTGGELFDDLVKSENYTERLAANCMTQLLNAVKYIHKMGVIHRDLKPENILLENVTTKNIKVADFGLAVQVTNEEAKWFGMAGTTMYMAPEVLEIAKYGKPVDLWACGVIMYILLVGYQPFHHRNEWRLHALIKTGDYEMSSKHWDKISDDAKELITKLLCIVPSRRLTAAQALDHVWFDKAKILRQHHSQDTVDNLKIFNAKRKFKAAVDIVKMTKSLKGSLLVKQGAKGSARSSTSSSATASGPK